MSRYKNKMLYLAVITLLVMLALPIAAGNAEEVGYSVRAIIPENQIDKSQSYFDLKMEPSQKQAIQVEILNSRNEDMEISVHITNPLTNRNGLIDYSKIDSEVDESLEIPITEVASIEENTVQVPAKGSRIVTIQIEMPQAEFDGMILGGIYFENVLDEEKPAEGQITNKFAYVIGLKLTENETEVKPNLQLKSVKPGLVNYHTAVIANIQNSASAIADHLSIKAKIYNSFGKEINKKEVSEYRMAPNTNMDFAIDWKNEAVDPGKYSIKIDAETGQQKWHWEEKFVIPKEEAKKVNEQAVEVTKDYTPYIIAGLSAIIIILLLLIFRMKHKTKSRKHIDGSVSERFGPRSERFNSKSSGDSTGSDIDSPRSEGFGPRSEKFNSKSSLESTGSDIDASRSCGADTGKEIDGTGSNEASAGEGIDGTGSNEASAGEESRGSGFNMDSSILDILGPRSKKGPRSKRNSRAPK